VVETVDANLSAGMRQLNGLYTQRFNPHYRMSGHLFQGRYKAILLQKEAHLLELSRYVVLNPVRAQMVQLPEEWTWSSYPLAMNDKLAPKWFDTDWLLGQFSSQRTAARRAFRKFVLQGVGLASPLLATKHQLLLGDDDFIKQHQATMQEGDMRELSIAHKRSLALSLDEYAAQSAHRNAAMVQAYRSDAYTMTKIAAYFSVHYMTVSRAVRAAEICKD
jgi:hypothetical protein